MTTERSGQRDISTEDEATIPRWAVTGPTGAGKSAVTALLARHGAEVVDADAVGHAVLELPGVRAAIASTFGSRFVETTDGAVGEERVDRAALGRHVFADPRELEKLNAITHPRLAAEARKRLDAIVADGRARLAVLEAAVYFLLPAPGPMDLTVAVTAPDGARFERLVSGGLDPEAARQRMAAQRSLEATFARADVTLVNAGGRDDLAVAVERLLEERLGMRG